MFTIVIAIFAGIFLMHIFADALKAAVVVVAVLGIFYICRGVSFSALVDEGAHELYNATSDHDRCDQPAPRRYAGRRI